MKQLLVLILLVVCMLSHAEDPWKLDLIDRNKNIILKINLDEECIEVPGMEAFGPMHGYLGGNVYGVWAVTSFRINNKKAILRLSNDLGSETQEVELTQTTDSTYQLKLVGTTVIKRVEGHKLHKISPTLTMVNNHK